ncbi:recombinase family protein [Patescibacteria group bacterium]|nr:recombinase family protein [Patescibacteria group bacterium]
MKRNLIREAKMETGIILLRESAENLLEGYGSAIQEAEARSWAEKRQIKPVGTELIVETGRTWNRERFEAAINDCIQRHKSERVSWVIFPRVDRDARKQIPFWYYLGMLDREGMKVGFAREDTTTDDPPEKLFMLSLHAYKAEADGNTIVTNLWDGKLRRAKEEGRFPSYDGGLWPYQYILSRKRKGGAVREIIPERAAWCRKWYEWLRQGMKGNEIAEEMNQSLVPPPRGKRWWRRTIFSILRNPGLRDKATWGGIPLPGASPAIFTEEEGMEIDCLLKGNLEKAKRNAKEDYELSQHVFCECGAKVWGRRNKIGNHIYIRYQCPQCQRYVDKVYLEALTRTKILFAFSDPDTLKTYLNGQEQGNTDVIKARLIDMGKQVDRRLTVLHNLRRQHAWGDLTDDEYQSERDRIKDDLAKLQQDREELQESYEATIDMERDTRILDRLADQISERLALNDVEALKRLYDTLKLKITLTDKAILFSSRIPLEELEVVEATSLYLNQLKP